MGADEGLASGSSYEAACRLAFSLEREAADVGREIEHRLIPYVSAATEAKLRRIMQEIQSVVEHEGQQQRESHR